MPVQDTRLDIHGSNNSFPFRSRFLRVVDRQTWILRGPDENLMEPTGFSKEGFGSEDEYRGCLCDGSAFAAVGRGRSRSFRLTPFHFTGGDASTEVLIVPPELAEILNRRIAG